MEKVKELKKWTEVNLKSWQSATSRRRTVPLRTINMEDLADALRMAANAADEHAEHTNMRGSLAEFVNAAQNIKCTTDQDDRVKLVDKLVEDLLAYGRMHNWIAMKG